MPPKDPKADQTLSKKPIRKQIVSGFLLSMLVVIILLLATAIVVGYRFSTFHGPYQYNQSL